MRLAAASRTAFPYAAVVLSSPLGPHATTPGGGASSLPGHCPFVAGFLFRVEGVGWHVRDAERGLALMVGETGVCGSLPFSLGVPAAALAAYSVLEAFSTRRPRARDESAKARKRGAPSDSATAPRSAFLCHLPVPEETRRRTHAVSVDCLDLASVVDHVPPDGAVHLIDQIGVKWAPMRRDSVVGTGIA